MTAIDTPAVDTDTTIQTLWKTLDLVNASTQFADTKGATILLVDGALATVTTARLVDAHSLLNKNYPLIALVVLGGLLWLASLYFAIQCVRPRLGGDESTSLIYFGHIARRYPNDFRQYKQAVLSGLSSEEQIVDQILQQIWANSRIATHKHANARLSLDFLILTVLLAIVVGGTIVVRGVV